MRKFEYTLNGNSGFFIPTCVTDIFIGTLIWLQSPAKVQLLNERRIIADCYASLQPSDLLIKKYLDAVEELKNSGKITNDEYYLLRTHRAAMNLLEEKTLGDPDEFDAKTPQEILDDIIAQIRNEEKKKYLEEKNQHNQTKVELDREKDRRKQLDTLLETRAGQISNSISMVISSVIYLLFLFSLVYQLFPSFFPQLKSYSVLLIVSLISGAVSILNGFNIRSFKTRLKEIIKTQILKYIKGNAV